MTHELETAATHAEPSATHLVHQLAQFLRMLRCRRNVVLASLVAAGLLGGLYYATATRYYQAKASLLILQTGNETLNTSMASEGATQGLMPTYERLITSAVVLEAALKFLGPEDRIDMAAVPEDRWADVLRQNLTVSTLRRTNLIEVSYRSRDPQAAVVAVNAVVRAYLEFMEKTHKGTAGEIIAVLTREKAQLEERLAQKSDEVLQLRRKFNDLGIRANTTVLHPVVQRAIQLNDAMTEAQKKRLQLQSSLAAVTQAVQRGEDLQQHMLAIEDAVGREFLLSGLGFNSRDAYTQSSLEKSLLDDQAELKTLSVHFGPVHPRVLEVQERMRVTQQYLTEYQGRVNQRLAHIRDTQLGPLLIQMVQQRLNETWQHEQSLRNGFEKARTEAVALNGELAQLEIVEHDLRWLRELRATLLNQIASIDLKQSQGEIRTAVVSEPVVSNSPVSPRLTLVGGLSAMLGLAVGIALAFVLDSLDDRFRSPDELRYQLGVAVLAMVRRLENLAPTGIESLQVHVAPEEVQSEAFRTLRTTLAFAGRDTQRLVVSSAEPGDGKTTVLANLAVSYAQAGKRTLLIDADMRRPGLTNLLEMRGLGGLSDVLRREENVVELVQAQIRPSGIEGLDVLPCGPRPSNPAELLAGPRFSDLLAWAETHYDQILVDGPPALAASDSAIIGRLVDGVVLVVRPDKNQRRPVVRAAESFAILGVTLLGVVINRASHEKDEGYYGYGYGYGYGGAYGYGEEHAEGGEAGMAQSGAEEADDAVAVEMDQSGSTGEPLVRRRAA
jgi:capsular exopolysaccharide synthesis family protein